MSDATTTRPVSERYNRDWLLQEDLNASGNPRFLARVQIVLLQEIRDELKQINATLGCRNTRDMPVRLRAIERAIKQLAPKEAR